MTAKKEDLINKIQSTLKENGVDSKKTECEAVLETVLSAVLAVAKEHGQVRTSIGTFKFIEKNSRLAQNPRTGEKVQVPAYKTLQFKAASSVKETETVAPAKTAKAPAAKAAPAKAAVAAKPAAKPAVTAKAPAKAAVVAKKPVAKK
jgi:nucleoid DNA-binding protein